VGFRLFLAAVEEMGCATFKKRHPYCVADKEKIRDKGRTKKKILYLFVNFFSYATFSYMLSPILLLLYYYSSAAFLTLLL
jgi:hypothetical protein